MVNTYLGPKEVEILNVRNEPHQELPDEWRHTKQNLEGEGHHCEEEAQ